MEEYLLLRGPHCRGFEQSRTQTVKEWMADQQILDYTAENDRLLEIIGLKNRLWPGRLSPETVDLVFTALYDLDVLREQFIAGGLPAAEALHPDFPAASVDDDLKLLHLGVVSQGTSIDLAGDKRSLQGRTDVKLLGTFAVAGDAIRTITDLVFDSKLGITVPVVKQLGTDNGIVRTMEISTDLIRSAPLVNGQRYYFAVTAYGYNPSDQALTHALESTPRIITAIPQTPNPGIRYSSSYGDSISYVKTGPAMAVLSSPLWIRQG